MTFEVILIHFYNSEDATNPLAGFFLWNERIAVPTFMFVSFVLAGKNLLSANNGFKHTIHRTRRLLTPIVLWTLVGFVFFKFQEHITLNDILWQLLTGHSYNQPMWFINDLLYITLVLTPICLTSSNRVKCLLFTIIAVLAFSVEYSGVEQLLVDDLRYELKYPAGRFIEMLPYACTGLILNVTGLTDLTTQHRKYTAIACVSISLVGCLCMLSHTDNIYTLSCAGIGIYLLTISFSTLFYIIPNRIFHTTFQKVLKFTSKYCLGIYCMHIMTGKTCTMLFQSIGLQCNTFVFCCTIFILSFTISALLAKIPIKFVRQSVI